MRDIEISELMMLCFRQPEEDRESFLLKWLLMEDKSQREELIQAELEGTNE